MQLARANALAEDQQKAIESIKQADAAVKLAHEKFSALAAENAGLKSDVPLGAIEIGRAFADRLENYYQFECDGGKLNMCSDWQEFRRCFEYLSEWVMHSQTDKYADPRCVIPLYRVPDKLPREYIRGWPLGHSDYAQGWNDCREAMLQGIQPVSQTYNLPELIEGMEVSIDVSTCDADLGNRYFGTVTEALELDTAKNGYILLVQDAEPNFDVNSNSPVTPDGWISCSERMPEDTKMLLAFSQGEIVAAYWNWVVNPIDYKKYRAFTYLSGNILDDVTHWMPLPEPPQGVK